MPKTARPKKQKTKHHQKSKSKLSLGIGALVFLLCLILFGKLLGFIGNLNQTPPPSADKIYSWTGEGTINLALKSEDVYILSFNPDEKSIGLTKIPEETSLNLPYNFGKWKVQSIYDLGQAEKPPMGAKLLKESLSLSLGLPVDGYIALNDYWAKKNIDELLSSLKGNPWESVSFYSQNKTDLSFAEYLRFWWEVRGVRSDKIRKTDLSQSSITKWQLESDGSRTLYLDPILLDQYMHDHFEDSKLKDEGFSIGIYNGTKHAGLAERAARIINNMGGRVIFTANSDRHSETSTISGRASYSLNRLEDVLRLNCLGSRKWMILKPDKCQADPSLDSSRADINIILGEDYFLRYNRK